MQGSLKKSKKVPWVYFDMFQMIFWELPAKDLIRFSKVSKEWKRFFEKFIKYHKIDLELSQITNKGLEHLKGVHTVDLGGCKEITDKGLEMLRKSGTVEIKK